MGLELKKCRALIKGVELIGTLHVDSTSLSFRSEAVKWSIQVGKGTNAKTVDQDLVVSRGSKKATFSVGVKAEKWVQKILDPPTLATKLGIKPGQRFWLSGDFATSFLEELKTQDRKASRGPGSCQIALILMTDRTDLKQFDKALKSCVAGTHIWAVWPKGKKVFGQSDVIQKARDHGIGPGKGISFDAIHSAMRFTVK